MAGTRRYTQRHYRDTARLLAAERAAHGASPALSRLVTAFSGLFAADAGEAGAREPYRFDPVLFGRAARGEVSPDAPRPSRQRRQHQDTAGVQARIIAVALRQLGEFTAGTLAGRPVVPHHRSAGYERWARGSAARMLTGALNEHGTAGVITPGSGSPFGVPLGQLDPAPAFGLALGEADYVVSCAGTVVAWHLGPEVCGVSEPGGDWIEVRELGEPGCTDWNWGRFDGAVGAGQDLLHAALAALAGDEEES